MPQYLQAQVSLKMLNDTTIRCNELLTQKRFALVDLWSLWCKRTMHDRAQGAPDQDYLVQDELQAFNMRPAKVKAVLLMLLQLKRVTSERHGGVPRYFTATK